MRNSLLLTLLLATSLTMAAEKVVSTPTKAQTVAFIQERLGLNPNLYEDDPAAATRTEYASLKPGGSDPCVLTYLNGNTSAALKNAHEHSIPMNLIAPGAMEVAAYDLPRNAVFGPEVARYYVVLYGTDQKKVIGHRFSWRGGQMTERDPMNNMMLSVRGITDREVEKVAKALAHLAKLCGAKDDLF